MICPGIGISADALFEKTARLPRVAIRKPARVIGSTTVGSLQSGLYYGYLGLVDGILERLLEEMGQETTVVATGGLAAADREGIEIHQACGRFAYPGRPAPHLGTEHGGEVRA